jgi:Leucine-rich repeat (LRR) protein
LVRLDAGNNLITTINKDAQVSMPKLVELSLMTNKLQEDGLAGLYGAPNLHTLDISSNQLQIIPASVTNLLSLHRLDVRGNQLHALPYELGKLEELKAIQYEGNPMRSFASMSQSQLIASLRSSYQQQLEEQQQQQQQQIQHVENDVEGDAAIVDLSTNFTQKVSLTMKLDLSNKQLTELPSESLRFTQDIPGTILLGELFFFFFFQKLYLAHHLFIVDHNQFTVFPFNLSLIASFIVQLNLEHNRLTSFNFNMDGIVFSSLKTLKLNNNRLKSIECSETTPSSFPKLEELVLNHNALTMLPENLAQVLPSLKVLMASSNKLDNITDQSFGQGLETLDLSNNDIGYLPPGLSAIDSLKELVVFGNRYVFTKKKKKKS